LDSIVEPHHILESMNERRIVAMELSRTALDNIEDLVEQCESQKKQKPK
jgi:hypothetical protein